MIHWTFPFVLNITKITFIFLPPPGDGRRQSAIVLPSPPARLCVNQNILIRSLCTQRLQFCANLVIANLWNGKRKIMSVFTFTFLFLSQRSSNTAHSGMRKWASSFHGSHGFDLLLFNGKSVCFFSLKVWLTEYIICKNRFEFLYLLRGWTFPC